MNQNQQNDYNRLRFEDGLSVLFIILNILNIKANTIIEESIKSESTNNVDKALEIYRFILVTTVILNFYFVIRNYNFYQNAKETDKVNEGRLEGIRFIGSILILIGNILLTYTVFNQDEPIGDVEL